MNIDTVKDIFCYSDKVSNDNEILKPYLMIEQYIQSKYPELDFTNYSTEEKDLSYKVNFFVEGKKNDINIVCNYMKNGFNSILFSYDKTYCVNLLLEKNNELAASIITSNKEAFTINFKEKPKNIEHFIKSLKEEVEFEFLKNDFLSDSNDLNNLYKIIDHMNKVFLLNSNNNIKKEFLL